MTPFQLERPILAVDVVLFAIGDDRLMVLTNQRKKDPFAGMPALPGAAVRLDEPLETAARRALAEKTDLMEDSRSSIFLDQLATFDDLDRDPRGRTISTAYMGVARNPLEDWGKPDWRPVSGLDKDTLAFDHGKIVAAAATRLAGKLRYTNIAAGFLPAAFRIEELQAVYEAILNRPLNRTNFRNKLLKIGLIEKVRILTEAVGKKGGRPPHLYRFTQDLIEAVDRDFL